MAGRAPLAPVPRGVGVIAFTTPACSTDETLADRLGRQPWRCTDGTKLAGW